MESVNRQLAGIKNDQIEKLLNYLENKGEGQSNRSFVQAYNKILNLSESNHTCPYLYNYYKLTIESYTNDKVKDDIIKKQGIMLVRTLSNRWSNHKILTFCLGQMFGYLDRVYTQRQKQPPLFLAGVSIFNNLIFTQIREVVQRAILDQIHLEREGQSIEIESMKECLSAFVQMGSQVFTITKTNLSTGGDKLIWSGETDLTLYQTGFEEIFLVETYQYYEAKAANWISSFGCLEYLQEVRRAFLDEEKRLKNYLDASTEEKLMKILTVLLVTSHAKTFCNMPGSGCSEMLKNNKLNELKLLFAVVSKDESQFVHVQEKFSKFIEDQGTSIVSEKTLQEDPIEYTKKVMMFKASIDEIVEVSFENHAFFQRTRDSSIQKFLNKCVFSAQFIASYCDFEMKKGLKGVSEVETDKRIQDIVKLFMCLYDRDVFIKYYTRYLAKRLLDETSISNEAEQRMISKLKEECGLNMIRNIASMYQDKDLSESLMKDFVQLTHKGSPNGTSLNVQVLRSGCWPEQTSEPCNIPKEMSEIFKSFELFYKNKHAGRNLVLLNNYGSLELGSLFCPRSYIFVVNPYQAAIILLFNSTDEITFQQILSLTHLSENTLKSNLLPFFNPKMKLLTKKSSNRVISNDESISLNLKFASATVKNNFLPKRVKKVESENKDDDKAIESERKFVIDSVIVRIAKGRKTIKHAELIGEVLKQVTMFKPQPVMIKAQIESLIQREFLKRDDDDKSLYIYLP
jgi:cullin 3